MNSGTCDEYGTQYPLATAQPYLFGRDLLLKLQEANQVPTELAVVVVTGQVISLADGAQRFFRKVEFNPTGGDVVRLLPAGQASSVSIDPLHNFGRPSVRGVATERLWELFEAGDSVNEIADGYDLQRHEVGAAVAYEEQLRTLAA